MTKEEAAIITAFTGILIGKFSDFHAYADKLIGRGLYTHEFASADLWLEIKEKSKKDFENIHNSIVEE